MLILLETVSQRLAPAHFPNTLPTPGARGYFDELTGPVLRAGPDVETRPHSPTRGTGGDRGRARVSDRVDRTREI